MSRYGPPCGLLLVGLLTAPIALARQAERADDADMYKRVLTLPGAALNQPATNSFEPVAGATVPVFTPYYVYGQRTDGADEWVEIGRRPADGAEGWIQADHLETWRNQLVMQYMPRGRRQRVVFFDERDTLMDALNAEDGATKAQGMITRIESDANDVPEGIIAVEPWEAVDQQQSMYLMPILDFKQTGFGRFYGGNAAGLTTTLVQVAGLNLEAAKSSGNTKLSQPPPAGPAPADASMKDFKAGIVFVMDTTASMGPYIQRTYDTVEAIYAALDRTGDLGRVSFGLVGYRDNMNHDPNLEYVTQVFQPLTPDADPNETLKNLKRITPAKASTKDWYEDAYAGIRVAVQELDWEPFDLRFIVLVSDAGPRPADDPLGSLSGAELEALQAEISRKHIALSTLHLLTPEGKQSGDHSSAARLYRSSLGESGDTNQDKYVGIRGGAVDDFTRQVTSFADALQVAIGQAAEGQVVQRPDENDDKGPEPDLGEILLNEIFRAQLEYLGRQRGAEAPRFYRAWAAENDLTNPAYRGLDVSVLLTKDQLNTLAARLGDILPALKAGEMDADEGWAQLVALSGRFATDPGRGDFVKVSDSGVLPGYLDALPYKSEILELTLEDWTSRGGSGQRKLINNIENRLLIYRDLAQDDRIWLDLGAGDPNLNVFPIPLTELP